MSVQVSRVLHAGYVFESKGVKILFDPIFENPFSINCYAYPSIEFNTAEIKKLQFDAVIISHYHDDHFSVESLHLLNRQTPIYLFSFFDEHFEILRSMGFSNIHSIQLMQPIRIGGFEIIPLRALDEDVDSIFHIKVADLNILNLVDSWLTPSTLDYLEKTHIWDLILWPFQTMQELEVISSGPRPLQLPTLPTEWLEQIVRLNPKVVVPSSCQFRFENWSTYNQTFFPISYSFFEKTIVELLPNTRVQRLNPGESFFVNQNDCIQAPRLNWVETLGSQNVDYCYSPDISAQPVSEIAKKFPALSENHKNEVSHFIKEKLAQRWSQLQRCQGSFFVDKKIWQLIVYSENGKQTVYFFYVNRNELIFIQSPPDLKCADWTTEISEYKLHRALTEGESLTSIYIRIAPAAGQDVLEDPLLRILYEGQVGHYQQGQLRKIGAPTV